MSTLAASGGIPPGLPSHAEIHRQLAAAADGVAHGYDGADVRYNFLARWHREFACTDRVWGADRRTG